MIERVVFDLGGVVFRWQPLAILQTLLPDRIRNEAEARHWAGEIFQTFHPGSDWSLFDLGQIEPQDLAERIAARTGLHTTEVVAVIGGIPPHLTPMAGTVDLIHRLHASGKPLFYLSNMPGPYAQRLVRHNGFFDRFQDGIFSAHVAQMKPEAPIFQNASERFGAHGNTTLFIDDVWANIEAAQAHGWRTVHFKSPEQCGAELQALGLV